MPEGQWGNLVVTTLDRDNGLLRYDLEEAAMLEAGRLPVPARRAGSGFWGGRFKDLLTSQGVHFQVSRPREGHAPGARAVPNPRLEFVVVHPEGSPDPLRIRVEVSAGAGPVDTGRADDVAAKVRVVIHESLGVESTIEVLDRETLPRSGYKLKRVVDS